MPVPQGDHDDRPPDTPTRTPFHLSGPGSIRIVDKCRGPSECPGHDLRPGWKLPIQPELIFAAVRPWPCLTTLGHETPTGPTTAGDRAAKLRHHLQQVIRLRRHTASAPKQTR